MRLTRRVFLEASAAAFATELFAGPRDSTSPNPALEKLADTALREAERIDNILREDRKRHPDRPAAKTDLAKTDLAKTDMDGQA